MTEPTTAAGKLLLADWDIIPIENRRAIIEVVEDEAAGRPPRYIWSPTMPQGDHAMRAVAAALARVRKRVEGLALQTIHADLFFSETYDYETVGRAAVLAILDEEAAR